MIPKAILALFSPEIRRRGAEYLASGRVTLPRKPSASMSIVVSGTREAQAIDRTHRIGQTRQVFAYRLITAGTIEEKVLQLQERKRALAEAILGAEGSPLSNLTREDLELLLS